MRSPLAAVLSLVLLAGAATLEAQTVAPLPKFDQTRYTGTWFEIARLPNKRQKKCAADVMQVVALDNKANHLQFVNNCKTVKGYLDVGNLSARSADKTGDGKLKISTLWPFTRPYWILAVGPDYDWSLAGTPNHKELWILSRKTTLDDATLTTIKAKADTLGFASSKLVMTPQTPR